jgi:preprotein translocase subunit SecG
VTGQTVSYSAIALTVVLVIIFVALLVVLAVLLTRKSKPTEEVETSYY